MNINIKVLKEILEEQSIEYEFIDDDQNFLRALVNNKNYYFHGSNTPLNSQDVKEICLDKEFTYKILKDQIQMPKTIGYFDPNTIEIYNKYKHFESLSQIEEDIKANFKFPFILKKNRGSTGSNVFLIDEVNQIRSSLEKIFDKNDLNYDYVALAQEYINIKREFRVTVLDKKAILVYEKDKSNAEFKGNLSPLHWEGSVARIIDNESLTKNIQEFISPIFKQINLVYGGLDILEDISGNFYLLELNASPAYKVLAQCEGEQAVSDIYKKIVEYIKNS